ncbi:MAG: hypothetical protein Alpg2KO_02920 [Alphaproteobacteria bacterium]
MEFALLPDVKLFTIALILLFLFVALELVSLVLGLGVSDWLDGLLPDIDTDIDLDMDIDADVDVDVDTDLDTDLDLGPPSLLMQGLSWLKISEVPFLVFLALFLALFGLSGLGLQSAANDTTGAPLHWFLALIGALIFTLPGVRLSAGAIGKVMPKSETSAISAAALIGRDAIITLGTARKNRPAEAKLTDEHGTTHYVMVEPPSVEDEYQQGATVKLLKRKRSGYIAKRVA